MRDLNYQLKRLCQRNHDGSINTRVGRERQLAAIANQLHDLGFKGMRASSLKQKHVKALVDLWQGQGLDPGTIKNRMNLRLQQAFGLRREEALKIQPRWADHGDHLSLKASWTKGGRAREVPIRNEDQRAVLIEAQKLAGLGSLKPADRNYIAQLRLYERQTANAGLSRMHGLRHAYAQQRYLELTGWPCPHAGGPPKRVLTNAQRDIDHQARLTISRERLFIPPRLIELITKDTNNFAGY